MQEFCPHCGEPIAAGARVCRNCGSDEETGWNPDSDYESVELPEDDDEDYEAPADLIPVPESAREGRSSEIGRLLVILSALALVATGFIAYSWAVLVPLGFLGACAILYAARSRSHDSLADRGEDARHDRGARGR